MIVVPSKNGLEDYVKFPCKLQWSHELPILGLDLSLRVNFGYMTPLVTFSKLNYSCQFIKPFCSHSNFAWSFYPTFDGTLINSKQNSGQFAKLLLKISLQVSSHRRSVEIIMHYRKYRTARGTPDFMRRHRDLSTIMNERKTEAISKAYRTTSTDEDRQQMTEVWQIHVGDMINVFRHGY